MTTTTDQLITICEGRLSPNDARTVAAKLRELDALKAFAPYAYALATTALANDFRARAKYEKLFTMIEHKQIGDAIENLPSLNDTGLLQRLADWGRLVMGIAQ